MEGYDLLASCTIGGVLVRKYRSQLTGLAVCLAQVEGPLVSGYFCLGKAGLRPRGGHSRTWSVSCSFGYQHFLFPATEAHDDDGLPHTLEHLVFMGSEQYPYKVAKA